MHWYKSSPRIVVPRKHQQEDIIGLPHLNLRLTIGVDLSSVEEVATYITVSLLSFMRSFGGQYRDRRPSGCTP
jgi:hypothetical protein